MKKLFLLLAFFTTVCLAAANAQDNKQAVDPAQKLEKYKERIKPQLMEKAQLTEAEADKVMTLHFTYARRLQTFKDASAEEKQRQSEIIYAAENKEYAAIPLDETKIKAVNAFWADQRKQMEKRREEGTKTNR